MAQYPGGLGAGRDFQSGASLALRGALGRGYHEAETERGVSVRETPLTEWHRQHGAKMMEFGGFLMPIEYGGGIIQEHQTVRTRVGMFDVSHMGEFIVSGEGAAEFLDDLVTNKPSDLLEGQVLYTPMCYPDGGTVDDLLVYRLESQKFLLVVNAGNLDKDWEWISRHGHGRANVDLKNLSAEIGLIALQGPQAAALLQTLTPVNLRDLPYYHATRGRVGDADVLISRTGYTGEDGFELYLKAGDAVEVWERLASLGARPVGLGARDTLRLEARLPLYDHELTAEISPLEAGLGAFIKWGKDHFVGKEALAAQKAAGLTRRLVGLEVTGGIARAGYSVYPRDGGKSVGVVTSGTKSPTLDKAIALALVDPVWAKVGMELAVEVRGRTIPAIVVKTPFYRRPAQADN